MKKLGFIFILSSLLSCSNYSKRFSYVDVRKEFEIDFRLNKDSTFILIDTFGCNVNSQKGKWKKIKNSSDLFYATYVLTDTIKTSVGYDIHRRKKIGYISTFDKKRVVNIVSRTTNNIFPIITRDTIYFYSKNIFIYKGFSFRKESGNIQNKRVHKLEDSLINIFGKKVYLRLYGGDRKSIKVARQNLKLCQ